MNLINTEGVFVHGAVKKGKTTQFFTHISPHIEKLFMSMCLTCVLDFPFRM